MSLQTRAREFCIRVRQGLHKTWNTYTYYHCSVFVLTFLSYASLHATRKTFSNAKSLLDDSWTPSNHSEYDGLYPPEVWDDHNFFPDQDKTEIYLGYLDSTFLFCYAVGLYISGFLGERFNLRYVLCSGMILSSVMVFIFGCVGEWVGIYSVYYYGIFWGLNGLLQSSGWPTIVAIMGNWFGKGSHGAVFGVWSANASVGNIIGAFLAASVLHYGYQYAFLVTSVPLFLAAVMMFFTLVEHPRCVGLSAPDEVHNSSVSNIRLVQDDDDEHEATPLIKPTNDTTSDDLMMTTTSGSSKRHKMALQKKAANFLNAFCLPGVVIYACSYACLKLVNYSFFFWLPYYLNRAYPSWASPAEAARLSTLYDVGGIIGGIIAGIISDLVGKRCPVVVTMLLSAIGILFVYQGFGDTPVKNAVLMTIAGIFVGGPANLISSAISADLGKQPALKGDSEALSSVTGIIDGTGSVGAALGQTIIPIINVKTNGWQWVFYFLMTMLFLSALCLSKLFYKDMRFLLGTLQDKLKAIKTKQQQ